MAGATMLVLLMELARFGTVSAAAIRVDPADVTHTIGWTHGCHTDLGYSHQVTLCARTCAGACMSL